MKKTILGMGNAVLDMVAPVSEDFLKSNKLSKGSMTLVDQEVSDKILSSIKTVKKDSGGSVANTIVGISLLGQDSFFCGKVKEDKLGEAFVSDMEKTGTEFLCEKSFSGLPTARCIVFVTPDGERSMQTFLGASTTLDESDIKQSFFENINYLLIEGYLWSSPTARNAIKKALIFCKKKKIEVVFSLSDSNLVKAFKNDFLGLIKSNVNILIGNENEFHELLSNNGEKSIFIDSKVELVVKTKGSKGVEVIEKEMSKDIPACEVQNVVDTTGAGDMFAAGFLFKVLRGEDPFSAASFGCKVASLIIQQYGARLSQEALEEI